ncbi:MAG: hypothetical protein ACK559_29020, partial [bacterium]
RRDVNPLVGECGRTAARLAGCGLGTQRERPAPATLAAPRGEVRTCTGVVSTRRATLQQLLPVVDARHTRAASSA